LTLLTVPYQLECAGCDSKHLSGAGLRYNDNAIGLGAQTERRGLGGPVRDLLGGETSLAAFLSGRRKRLLAPFAPSGGFFAFALGGAKHADTLEGCRPAPLTVAGQSGRVFQQDLGAATKSGSAWANFF
jgi:hypothetical protein